MTNELFDNRLPNESVETLTDIDLALSPEEQRAYARKIANWTAAHVRNEIDTLETLNTEALLGIREGESLDRDVKLCVDQNLWKIRALEVKLREHQIRAEIAERSIPSKHNGHEPSAKVEDATEPTELGASLNAFPLTDAGNSESLAALYGDRVRYDHRRARWLIWGGHIWDADTDGKVERLAIEATRERERAASEIEDVDKRRAALRWALASESRQRQRAMLDGARILKPIADAGNAWDKNGYLLGCANGIVDLSEGTLRDGEPEDGITLSTRIAFDPGADCPRWIQFLSEIFEGDDDLIAYVQRAIGYTLTAQISEQALFVLYGTGANGKSVFINALRYVFGDYAALTGFSTFERTDSARPSNDLAALAGARLACALESKEGALFSEERVKALTGGDAVSARFLFREFFTYEPKYKIWIGVNHRPRTYDNSFAFWRRIHLIPFKHCFTAENADPNLLETLKGEASGILTWAVLGCLEWQKTGLKPPRAVLDATAEYREENDITAQFIAERCVESADAHTTANALYKVYEGWATESGDKPMSKQAFGRRIIERGIKRERSREDGKFKVIYRGIGILQAG